MKIIITEPFKRKLKKLKKNYPNIKNDLNELLSDMEDGSISGVPIPGLFNIDLCGFGNLLTGMSRNWQM